MTVAIAAMRIQRSATGSRPGVGGWKRSLARPGGIAVNAYSNSPDTPPTNVHISGEVHCPDSASMPPQTTIENAAHRASCFATEDGDCNRCRRRRCEREQRCYLR